VLKYIAIANVVGISAGFIAEALIDVPKSAIVALAVVAAVLAILAIWFEWLLPLAVAIGSVVLGIVAAKAVL